MIQHHPVHRALLLGSLLFCNSLVRAGSEVVASPFEPPEDPSPDAPSEPQRQKGARSGLEEIEVRGQRTAPVRQRLVREPEAIGTVTRQELERSEGLFLEEAINLIPGVRLENRTLAGGQRIIIRGYGNNTNFNGTGYKAYLNGIPLIDAEGIPPL